MIIYFESLLTNHYDFEFASPAAKNLLSISTEATEATAPRIASS